MRLEQCVSSKELNKNTTNTPDITRKRPTETEDDLWGPVVPSGHNRRVVLILKGRRSKVNQPDLRVKEHLPLSSLSIDGSRRRRNSAAICECLVRTITQKDVFWFEIGVDEVQVMEDCYS